MVKPGVSLGTSHRDLVVLVGRIFVLCYNHGVDGEATQGNPGLLAVQQGALGCFLVTQVMALLSEPAAG